MVISSGGVHLYTVSQGGTDIICLLHVKPDTFEEMENFGGCNYSQVRSKKGRS